ncbi:pyruvate dehydrogenase complex dihydrolipoamide acetyltransferase [Roseospira marina]|uniref:Acetyltransferase component of pyruvate dehydrogenase complex n=1 Tax=Roseospira marina TaxID=140057 RepID=A0A5M6IGB8_9PROT|nr:pyruvate dehydrogenase complex dihydrolipoamide acetyltransferase [Roseospira marina]KAA5607264.1 pyruvate dehydrogenase complex dihydrolipoamide acetyltransferase [Roseospira marina]MBB4312583.1 pyruvate dehydrogenase E2 component (dihydrolipoamide acetyltransferase) [Roseospira marina]MBB5085401.1 pyruvate dehydrogenase E2 component (dihydrolipoamide acetyltransferase) [Roseospira marina]
MPTPILMPALSPTMEEGTLARWMKKEGDTIESGDVIAEIETDKATMDYEAVDEGTLGRILVPAGTEGVKVNQPIALLLAEGEDASTLDSAEAEAKTGGKSGAESEDTGAPKEPAGARGPKDAKRETPAPASDGPVRPAPPAPTDAEGERVFASPLARRLAAEAGLDLAGICGSGPHGRVVRADVEKARKDGAAATPTKDGKPADAAATPPAKDGAPTVATPAKAVKSQLQPWQSYTEVPNSQMRKVIGRRLVESKQTVPHFYLTIDCALDPLLDLRKQLNARAKDGEYKISVNDLIIKAAAAALRRVPAANAVWTDEAILMLETVDISVAVATDRGLITPIIRDADTKGLATIAAEMKDLAVRARDGKLKPEEFQGGGFSVSNLGMYGIREFSAIINPPQSCILAVGQGEQRPVVKDGALTIATMMSCTLSVDHRSVDGAVGAEYLAAFKVIVEDPLSLLL